MENLDQETLRNLESKCVQEEEPWCNAMCPIHMDVRELCKLISNGNFTEGRKIYEKKVIFPNIMSKICEQTCKIQCKRKELGKSLNIRDLELACMDYGKEKKIRTLLKPKKKEKIAIFGGCLGGMASACELKNKGYLVDFYEIGSILGEKIYEDYKDKLNKETIGKDLKKLENLGVKIYLQCDFDKSKLDQYKEKYDSIIIDGNIYDLNLNYNEITFQYNESNVFYIPKNNSSIESIDVGKRIATSMDRYFQKSNMIQGREKEGIYETKLYTSLENISVEEEIHPSNDEFYSEEEAINEAKRCIDCNCLECVKGCEFLRHYKSYPKRMAREVHTNLAIALGNRTSNKMIDSCSLCGQCRNTCPGGIDLGEVCEWARKTMVETNKMPPSAFEFAMEDMEFSNSEEFFTVINKENLNYVFFPGCQLCASEPELVKIIYKDLNKKLNDEAGMILGCCGVIGKWSGHIDEFDKTINKIKETIEKLNNPTVITACPTCYKIFNSNINNIQVDMIYDFIYDDELKSIGNNKKIAIDDPCTVRENEKLQDRVREIGKKLGFHIEELDYNRDKTTCCGYGGLTCFSNQELRENIITSRTNQSELDYLTYCINCRDGFLSKNKISKHILQLIYNFEGKNKKPNISERRYNRVQLKLDLTEDKKSKNNYDVNLVISEELKEKLEEKMILEKDIEQTILYSEETKNKFINKVNNHYISYHKIRNVTFWVEYTLEDNKYIIHNAYSHRMEIEVD